MKPNELLSRIDQLRLAFEVHFENPWLYMLLDGLPVDPALLKDVRDFLHVDDEWGIDETRAREGVRSLELFIQALRNHLLPCIKEKLRISPLKPEAMIDDPDQRTIRGLVAYSLPIKVALLEDQVKALRRDLEPEMQAADIAPAGASA